jgi:hypothetical protein
MELREGPLTCDQPSDRWVLVGEAFLLDGGLLLSTYAAAGKT